MPIRAWIDSRSRTLCGQTIWHPGVIVEFEATGRWMIPMWMFLSEEQFKHLVKELPDSGTT